jgi:hypothetical protein
MPILLALVALAGAAYFWMNRARNAANVAADVVDMAETALGAARRFGFRRKADRHPIESIEEANLAIGGLATAFLELSGLPTTQEKQALTRSLQAVQSQTPADAEENNLHGPWLVNTIGGAQPAVTRLAKRVNKLAGAEGLTTSMRILQDIAEAGGGVLSPAQGEALDEIKRVFRIR